MDKQTDGRTHDRQLAMTLAGWPTASRAKNKPESFERTENTLYKPLESVM